MTVDTENNYLLSNGAIFDNSYKIGILVEYKQNKQSQISKEKLSNKNLKLQNNFVKTDDCGI